MILVIRLNYASIYLEFIAGISVYYKVIIANIAAFECLMVGFCGFLRFYRRLLHKLIDLPCLLLPPEHINKSAAACPKQQLHKSILHRKLAVFRQPTVRMNGTCKFD